MRTYMHVFLAKNRTYITHTHAYTHACRFGSNRMTCPKRASAHMPEASKHTHARSEQAHTHTHTHTHTHILIYTDSAAELNDVPEGSKHAHIHTHTQKRSSIHTYSYTQTWLQN